jgi:ParB family transcriptional regulator, chromosome partitioning protein
VWEAISHSWSKEPLQIRRMLTETTVRASDKRAVFVGVDAYQAAGGCISAALITGIRSDLPGKSPRR